jgi:hypothetical protein
VEADGYGKATYIIVYKKVTKKRQRTDPFGRPILDELTGRPAEEEYETVNVSKWCRKAYFYRDVDTGRGSTRWVAGMGPRGRKTKYNGIPLTRVPGARSSSTMVRLVHDAPDVSAFPRPSTTGSVRGMDEPGGAGHLGPERGIRA